MKMLLASLPTYTYQSFILLVLLAPLTAFGLFRSLHRPYRVAGVLAAHAIAIGGAVYLGVSYKDRLTYELLGFLRKDPRYLLRDGYADFLFVYGLVFSILILPALCGIFMIIAPDLAKRYFCILPILAFLGFLSLSIYADATIMLFAVALAFLIVGILMIISPQVQKVEPGAVGNEGHRGADCSFWRF